MNRFRMSKLAIVLISISALLVNTSKGALRTVGYTCVIISFLLFLYALILAKRIVGFQRLFTLFLPLIFAYTIGFVRVRSGAAAKDWALLVLTVIMVLSAANHANEIVIFQNRYIRKWMPIAIGIMLASMLLRSSYNPIDKGLKSIYATSTFLGIFCVLLAEICLLNYQYDKRRRWLLYALLLVLMVFRSKVRTAYIGALLIIAAFLVSYWLGGRERRTGRRKYGIMKWCRIAMYAVIVVFILVYPVLTSLSFFEQLADWVYRYTGKILMSGRQGIWATVISYVKLKPLFGYGLANDVMETSRVHSSYLNVLIQTGFFGIFGLFVAVNTLLRRIEGRKTPSARTIQLFSCINLIMCVTEVMLLQGQIILQILIWMLMAIGMGYSENADAKPADKLPKASSSGDERASGDRAGEWARHE